MLTHADTYQHNMLPRRAGGEIEPRPHFLFYISKRHAAKVT